MNRTTLLSTLFLCIACGTRAGNPKNPNEPKSVIVPSIEIGLVDSKDEAIGESGAGSLPDSSDAFISLGGVSKRSRFVVDALNDAARRINDIAPQIGIAFDLPSNDESIKLTGWVTDLTGDPIFAYQGTLCLNDKPFYHVRWDATGEQIAAARDFREAPFGPEPSLDDYGTEIVAEVEYLKSATDDDKVIFDTRLHGRPKVKDIFLKDLPYMLDHVYYSSLAGGAGLYSGIRLWMEDREKIPSFDAAQNYGAGVIEADGSSRNVFYHSGAPLLCRNEYDSSNAAHPGWCLGLALDKATNKVSYLGRKKQDEVWKEVGAVGVPASSTLRAVELPKGLTCPP